MINKKKFNDLTLEELYNIYKLRSEVFCLEQEIVCVDPDKYDLLSTHYFLKDEKGIYAYLRLIDKDAKFKNECSIGRLCVRLDMRKKGYARMLMEQAIIDADGDIRISGQAYLKEAYESMGFKIVSDTYFEEGILHFELFYGKH